MPRTQVFQSGAGAPAPAAPRPSPLRNYLRTPSPRPRRCGSARSTLAATNLSFCGSTRSRAHPSPPLPRHGEWTHFEAPDGPASTLECAARFPPTPAGAVENLARTRSLPRPRMQAPNRRPWHRGQGALFDRNHLAAPVVAAGGTGAVGQHRFIALGTQDDLHRFAQLTVCGSPTIAPHFRCSFLRDAHTKPLIDFDVLELRQLRIDGLELAATAFYI